LELECLFIGPSDDGGVDAVNKFRLAVDIST
jgi:hypothetical protein